MDVHLNLLLDILEENHSLKYFGKKIRTPLLRPVFYDGTRPLEEGRIYLTKPDVLPPKQMLNSNMLMICAEGSPSLAYEHSGQPLLVIQEAKILSLFNEILDIYERYDKWEKSLNMILSDSADIPTLVELTAPLVMNDITVIDRELHVIAFRNFNRDENGMPILVSNVELFDTLTTKQIVKYKKEIEENRKKNEPFFSDDGCYCINLFPGGDYFGNVSLYPRLHPIRSSDPYIISVLAEYILKALNLHSINLPNKRSQKETLIQKLLEGEFLSEGKLTEMITEHQGTDRFLCLCFSISDNTPGIPTNYICDKLRKHFRGLLLVNYDGHIVGVQDFTSNIYDNKYLELLNKHLEDLNLRVGLSNRFNDLRKVRFYFLQAKIAMEVGMTANEQCRLFQIPDQALRYLMLNSAGMFPAEYICPQALLKLRTYNENHEVDYWSTLRCYLDLQMNIAETARNLDIHRNTLIQRIVKINSIFGSNLQNPIFRLWLRMSIYLFDQEAAVI